MYDVVVIGGGPGGYAAAIRASQLKAKVAIVEAETMGGTCVLRGCIPSKVWLETLKAFEQAKRAGDFGIEVTTGKIDLATVVARKKGVSNDIHMGMEALLANNEVDVLRGKGIIESPNCVLVDGKAIETKNIIVATGSTIAMPDISGLEALAFTTNDLLEMQEVPASILVTDPTYIGVEMAILLNGLGAKVTFALAGSRILPDEDADSAQRIAQALRERGIDVKPRHSLVKVAGKTCILKNKDKEVQVEVDKVLVSSRKPVNKGLGLEAMGVSFKEDGGIVVDEHCCTDCPGIYAIGDCTGGWMLSHVASAMGITAAENCMGQNSKFAANLISRALWSSPEMGSVGLSEEEAERKGYDVEVGSFPYSINGYAMLCGEVDGAVKLVSDSETGEILGVHIVGSQAVELIGEAVTAMQLECTVKEFAKGFRVHPAFSETVVDAARDAAGWALYLPKR